MTATPDFYAWIVVILLTLVVLWRLRAAITVPASRTLWFVFAALDVAMVTRIDSVGRALHDVTGINDAATLTKHLVGIAAVAGLLRWVTAVVPGRIDGKREPGYRRAIDNAPRRIATWCAIVVVTAIFPLAYRRSGVSEDADFIFLQAGHLWGSLHLLLFYTYLTFGLVCAAMMCSAAWRAQHSAPAFRRGMLALSLGCAIGACYGILRSGYLIVRLFDRPFLGGETLVEVGSNLTLIGCVILVVIGSAAPAWERMHSRMEAHGAINDLRPMWRTLTTAVPAVVYQGTPPHQERAGWLSRRAPRLYASLSEAKNRASDFWSWQDLDYRLRRRITEICDAAILLQPYIPAHLRQEAQDAAHKLNLPDHVVPAYLLHAAMQRMAAGNPPSTDSQPENAVLRPKDDLQRTTRALLPIGSALTNSATMAQIERCGSVTL